MNSFFSAPIYFDAEGGRYSDYKNKKKPNSMYVSYYQEENEEKVASISFKANLKEDRLRIAVWEKGECNQLIDNLEFLDRVRGALRCEPWQAPWVALVSKEIAVLEYGFTQGKRTIEIKNHSEGKYPKIEIDLQDFPDFVMMVESIKQFIETNGEIK